MNLQTLSAIEHCLLFLRQGILLSFVESRKDLSAQKTADTQRVSVLGLSNLIYNVYVYSISSFESVNEYCTSLLLGALLFGRKFISIVFFTILLRLLSYCILFLLLLLNEKQANWNLLMALHCTNNWWQLMYTISQNKINLVDTQSLINFAWSYEA